MKKLTKILILALAFVLLFGVVCSSAYVAYDTYTYSISGKQMLSPAAYSTNTSITSTDMGLKDKFGGLQLNDAEDIVTDEVGNVYIADAGNNRIVVLDKYYKVTNVIDTYYDEAGKEVKFNHPEGVFVTDPGKTADGSSYIYVCDTKNKAIVVYDRAYNYVRTITAPSSPLLDPADFVPNAVAVDIYGRIFVVAEQTYEGIIVLSNTGEFTGYIGAQKVSYSIIDIIWRKFQTKEQLSQQTKNLSDPYNNITVDDDGFVYATSDQVDETQQYNAIKSKASDYSPVKKLNSTGHEIMKRNGFFDPGGEVDVFYAKDVSKISDVALGPEGMWTILDYKRSKLFTYDQQGNLLFAFGDGGEYGQGGELLGNGENLQAITYQTIGDTSYLLVLDETSDTSNRYKLVVYSPTEYCETIISALRNQNEHDYDSSIRYWQDVLTKNNNFDLAYIGIGKALFSQGKYQEAYEVLQNAYETTYASKAFAEVRKDLIGNWIILIVIVAIALIIGAVKFLGYAKRKNKATSLKVGRKTYWEELLYVFHLCFHPFDGFWDLKHEKRGSVRAASTILGITILALFYNSIGKGYLFNPEDKYSTIIVSIISVAIPVILWSVSNWCLTTLFDGEGSFRDIYIATCYSLAPLPLFFIVSTVLTNVMTTTEGSMVNLLITIGVIWMVMLLFFGTLVTHDYSLGKNVITMLGTILAMLVIMFVIILFSSLVMKMVTFVIAIVKEVGNRM
jgi:hypothetical protein